jgi:peptide deformylase
LEHKQTHLSIALIGEKVLQEEAKDILESDFKTAPLRQFVEQLLSTMLSANGIGIAAPQVFDDRAILIIASKPNPNPRYPDAPDMEPLVMINPRIISQSNERCWEWEGCLSVPGLRGYIQRPSSVEVNYRCVEGTSNTLRLDGFIARIFLHEYDHLVGKTWLDHIVDSKHIMANEVWANQC